MSANTFTLYNHVPDNVYAPRDRQFVNLKKNQNGFTAGLRLLGFM